jgi:hypothetical protein
MIDKPGDADLVLERGTRSGQDQDNREAALVFFSDATHHSNYGVPVKVLLFSICQKSRTLIRLFSGQQTGTGWKLVARASCPCVLSSYLHALQAFMMIMK